MGTVHATDRDGTFYELPGRARASLMEILRHAGLAVEALCGGNCQCATCHVYVAPEWLERLPPAGRFETTTLEYKPAYLTNLLLRPPIHSLSRGVLPQAAST